MEKLKNLVPIICSLFFFIPAIAQDVENEVWEAYIPEIKATVNIFPNPAKDHLTVTIDAEEATLFIVEMVSLDGKKTFAKVINANYFTTIAIDVANFPRGIYVLHVINMLGENVNNQQVVLK